MRDDQPIRILSLDGGGVRGYAQALILEQIERDIERPIFDLFDVVAGTSIGALIGAVLVRDPEVVSESPDRWAHEVAMGFEEHAPDIFDEGWLFRQSRRGMPSIFRKALLPRKARENNRLNEFIKKFLLDDVLLTNTACEFVAPAYDVSDPGGPEGNSIVVFSTSSAMKSGPEVTLGAVARASSAAPWFFPPEPVEWGITEQGATPRHLIDGGVFANNPVLLALAQTWEQHAGRPTRVLSIGTGFNLDRGIWEESESGAFEASNFGITRGVSRLIQESSSQAALWTVERMVEQSAIDVGLLTVQPQFSKRLPELDQADPETLKIIESAAKDAYLRQGKEIRDWVSVGLN